MKDLRDSIIEDGMVDAEEVRNLDAEIFDDGIVTDEEIRVVFEINDATEDNHESFQPLMVKATKAWCFDGDTVVDAKESALLVELIGDEVDANETAVLEMVKETATVVEGDALNALLDGLA